jgi:hypothetical protein
MGIDFLTDAGLTDALFLRSGLTDEPPAVFLTDAPARWAELTDGLPAALLTEGGGNLMVSFPGQRPPTLRVIAIRLLKSTIYNYLEIKKGISS